MIVIILRQHYAHWLGPHEDIRTSIEASDQKPELELEMKKATCCDLASTLTLMRMHADLNRDVESE